MPNKQLEQFRVPPEHDKRRRLTPEQRAHLLDMKGHCSVHEVARTFNVSRRLVQFIWYPERLETLRQQRKGCWKNYYETEKRRLEMRKHRAHKREIMTCT